MTWLVKILAVVSILSSCAQGTKGEFHISAADPRGVYQVELRGRLDPPDAAPGEFYVQKVKLEASRHNKVVFSDDEFYREDPYDPLFLQAYPTREWVNDSTLRLGRRSGDDPFQDEIEVTNNTGSRIDFLTLRHGRYELFLVFALEPNEEITLHASPQLNISPPASAVWYAAYMDGQRLQGTVHKTRPGTRASGPQTIQVTVERG